MKSKIDLRISEDLKLLLQDRANNDGKRVSEVVRQILTEYFKLSDKVELSDKPKTVATKEPQQDKPNTDDNEPAWKVRLKEQQEALKRSKKA